MPIGVPSSVARVTIASEPKIAFASPPISACGGGVISVKSDRLIPPTPRRTVSTRIQISQKMPNAIASSASVSATALRSLRRAWRRRRATCAASSDGVAAIVGLVLM